MLYSELKGKKVYAIDTALCCGEVAGVYIDPGTYVARHLVLSDEKNSILSYADIFGFGENLTVRSAGVLAPFESVKDFTFFDIGLPVIDVDGNPFGRASELDLHARTRERRFTADCPINIKAIVSSSKEAIIVNPRHRLIYPKPAPVISEEAQPAEPQKPYEEINIATATYREPPAEKINNDYSFLLGRRVERDITDITRTFVIRAGTVITERIIDSAKKAGKLVDLTINSAKR